MSFHSIPFHSINDPKVLTPNACWNGIGVNRCFPGSDWFASHLVVSQQVDEGPFGPEAVGGSPQNLDISF
eukprot:scaffold272753_cov34-Prasinocladus_malaysianus.AAC.1